MTAGYTLGQDLVACVFLTYGSISLLSLLLIFKDASFLN